jgi:hypothetical protein
VGERVLALQSRLPDPIAGVLESVTSGGPAPAFAGFRPAAFQFLRDLSRNNRKEWFEAHRDTYEREVREPMRELV